MADSTSGSSFSLSRFLSLQTEDDDEEDEVNEDWASFIEDEDHLRIVLDKDRAANRVDSHVDDWIKISRSEAIQWIFNTRSSLRFQFQTAYLSVTYLDRFLSQQSITESKSEKPWAIQLLAIACLSLAAKMIERPVSALSSLHSDEFQFTKNTIQRMELLVLTTLDWQMHSITPFHFIRYFVSCFRNESSPQKPLLSLISHIICATTNDVSIMGHRSSSVAMAATLMAMGEEDLSRESMEMKVRSTLVNQNQNQNQLFDHADVYTCYTQMLKLEPLKVNIAIRDLTNNKGYTSRGKESIKRKRS